MSVVALYLPPQSFLSLNNGHCTLFWLLIHTLTSVPSSGEFTLFSKCILLWWMHPLQQVRLSLQVHPPLQLLPPSASAPSSASVPSHVSLSLSWRGINWYESSVSKTGPPTEEREAREVCKPSISDFQHKLFFWFSQYLLYNAHPPEGSRFMVDIYIYIYPHHRGYSQIYFSLDPTDVSPYLFPLFLGHLQLTFPWVFISLSKWNLTPLQNPWPLEDWFPLHPI